MGTEHFWNMFVIDAFLGNFDRHNGNWGFLVDRATDETEIAPIFDCGSCLLPQANESIMKKVLLDENEMNARVYQFPTSAIQCNGKKINYYDFLMSCEYRDCSEALLRIAPRIDMQQIQDFINDIDCIKDLQKEFYIEYLYSRYNKIIVPSYNQVIENDYGMSMTM